ncbi:hypothetical protein HanIR_Chr13g0652401 [Helianthus annuus]|nr:hypothetical protein HanIR_Chr13g0652401 [Helianthus annuus]
MRFLAVTGTTTIFGQNSGETKADLMIQDFARNLTRKQWWWWLSR